MRCPHCEADTPDGVRFCIECGTLLTPRCPQCGADTLPRAKFCGACGTPLTAQSPAPPAAPPPSPLQYTPGYLAEKILTSKAGLEGERKQVTVLFADLKGSMELLADRDPEEARTILDPVLERMMDAVHRYEGTVNQVMGDGIMALFGAPIAHEDHAVRACYAALRMQETVTQYGNEVQRSHGIPIQMRVGLNSGEVVVRAISNDLHMDYSAIGQTTHLAARMEQLAPPGTIRLTAETLRLVEGWVQVTPLGLVPVKGLPAPIDVCELVGAGPVRMRLQTLAARGLTPFVGRQTELAALHQALEQAGAGHGQVVAVIGEPGVGKTRLFHEFTQASRPRGWLLLESSSTSYGQATPYLPVVDLLKDYFQIDDRDEERKIRDKVSGKLVTLETALGPTLPAFLTLLDLPVEDRPWQALDPPQRRQRTHEALKHLLLRESQVQPLVLVVENLHWIDAETQACLDGLVEGLPSARILLLVNYRPEYQHGWGHKTYYTQLRLDPLPPASAEALLESLLGDDASLEPLTQRLIQRTQRNPFFLEESIRTLVETQGLVGEPGAYRLAKTLPSIQVPATVQAVLAARIDRLPPAEKELLQTAAVIGTEVPLALLETMAEAPEESLRLGLTHLQAAEFLYETRLFPEHEYTFKHALTQQVAYEMLLQERRQSLHARIVAALEALAGDRVAEQVERLTHHALRGELWEKALRYCRQAGAKAATRSAYREAVAFYEQALEALQHLPERRDTREQAIDLRMAIGAALWPLGNYEQRFEYLRQAETLAEGIDDKLRLGRLCSAMIHHFRLMGDEDRLIEYGQRALAVARAVGDFALEVRTTQLLGRAYFDMADYQRAIRVLRKNVAALEGDRSREQFATVGLVSVLSRTWLALSLAECGEFAEGIAHGEEAVRIAKAVDEPYSLLQADLGVGTLYLTQGDLPNAIRTLERDLELYHIWDLPLLFPWITSHLGYAYALAGRVGEALPLLEQAMNQATSLRSSSFPRWVAWLSEACRLAGRLEDALHIAGRAVELPHTHIGRAHQARALRVLGDIAAQRNPPNAAGAEGHYREALALAVELGMRPLQAHCHLGLGTLYAKTGQPDQARAALSTAIELYRTMEMTFWLLQAEAALAQVEGP